jgi:hypothetical protein
MASILRSESKVSKFMSNGQEPVTGGGGHERRMGRTVKEFAGWGV